MSQVGLATLAVPEEADAEDAAALVADAAICTAMEVVSAAGVEGHLPVPGGSAPQRPPTVASRNSDGRRCHAVQPGWCLGSDAADGP